MRPALSSLLGLVLLAAPAAAQTVWTGAAGSSWNNSANWTAGVPTSATDAVIAAAAVQPSSFLTDPVCNDLTIESGATLTLGGGFDLLVTRNLSIQGSLVVGSASSDVSVQNTWTNDGTFTAGGGTVELLGTGGIAGASSTTFHDLVISGGTRTATAVFTATGDVTVTGGATLELGGLIHQVQGNWVSSAAGVSVVGPGAVNFTGDGLLATGSNPIHRVQVTGGTRSVNDTVVTSNLRVDAGTLVVLDDATVAVGGDLELLGGTLSFASTFAGLDLVDVEGDTTIDAAASGFSSFSTIRCAGAWASTATFAPAAGVVELDGAGTRAVDAASLASLRVVSGTAQVTAPMALSGDLTIDDAAVLDADAALTVAGHVALGATSSWHLGGLAHVVGGDWTSAGGSATGAGEVRLDGDGSLATGGGSINAVTVVSGARTASGASVSDALSVTGGSLTIQEDSTLAVGGSASITGGALGFAGTTPSPEILDVEGDVTITTAPGSMTAEARIHCGGAWSSDAAWAPALGTVLLDGGATATIGGTGTTLPELVVVDGARTLVAAASIGGDLRVDDGAALVLDAALTVGGDASLGDGTASVDLGGLSHVVAGSWTSAGASATDGTVVLDGAGGGVDTGGGSIARLEVLSGARDVSSSTVTGDLVASGGSLSVLDAQTVAVGGDALLGGSTLALGAGAALDVEGSVDVAGTTAGTIDPTATISFAGTGWSADATFVPAAGLVRADGDLVTISGTAASFADLELAGGPASIDAPLAVSGDLDASVAIASSAAGTVSGAVTLGDGTTAWDLGGLQHAVAGNLVASGASVVNGTVETTGDGDLDLGGGDLPSLLVSGGIRTLFDVTVTGDVSLTGGVLRVDNDQTVHVLGNASFTGGLLSWFPNLSGTQDEVLDVDGDVVCDVGLEFESTSGRFLCGGDWSAAGAFAPAALEVVLDGAAATTVGGAGPKFFDLVVTGGTRTVTSAALVAGDLRVESGATLDADAALDVNGDVTLGDATASWDLGGLVHTVAGDYTSAGADAVGPGTVRFDGTGTTATGGGSIAAVLVSAGARSLQDTDVLGDLSLTGGGIGIQDNATVTVGGNASLTGGLLEFVDATAGIELLDVAGDVTLTAGSNGTTANSRIECAGNWSSSSAWTPASGVVALDGGGATTIGGASPRFATLEIVDGTKTLVADAVVSAAVDVAAGQTLDLDAVLDLNGAMTVAPGGALDVGALTHLVKGDWTSDGATVSGTGIVRFDGIGTTHSGSSVLPNVDVTAGQRTMLDTDVAGDLTMDGGGMGIADNATVHVGGNAALTAGVLQLLDGTPGPQTLDVDGDLTLLAVNNGTTADAVVRCGGSLVSGAAWTVTAGLVVLDGAGAATVSGTGLALPNVRIESGAVTLLDDAVLAGDLELLSGASLDTQAALDVAGSVTLGDATAAWTLGSSAHAVDGDWTSSGASATGTGSVELRDAGSLATGGGTIDHVLVSGGLRTVLGASSVGRLEVTGGELHLSDDASLAVSGDADLVGGTVSWFGTSQGAEEILDVEGAAVCTAAVGTTSASSVLRCAGDWTASPAFAMAAGRVELDGAGTTLVSGDPVVEEVVLSGGVRVVDAASTLSLDDLSVVPGATLRVATPATLTVPGGSLSVDGLLEVQGGARLALGAPVALLVSGTLRVVGSPGSPAVVGGHAGGGYLCQVDGTIEAASFRFEEPGPSGISIDEDAVVAAAPHDLRGGVFSSPSASPGSVLLHLERPAPTTFSYLGFEDPLGVGTYNVEVLAGAPVTFLNATGDFAGEAFELDPFDRVDWTTLATNVATFTATPGPDVVDLAWTTTAEVDTSAWAIERGTSTSGPFTEISSTAAAGPGAYAVSDVAVVSKTKYVYNLVEEKTHGAREVLATVTATPWTSGLPANFLSVGPGGDHADVQTALDAITGVNPVVYVAAGTYPAFTIDGGLGTVHVLADGSGPVVIDTSGGPAKVQNLGPFDEVVLDGLTIGDGTGGNDGLQVTSALGVVILDECAVTSGGAGTAALRLESSTHVAVQRTDVVGGLVATMATAVVGGGTLDTVDAASGSGVRLAGLPAAPTLTVDGSSTVSTLAGVHADVETAETASLGGPVSIDLAGEPFGIYALHLGIGLGWYDLPGPPWEMVGLLDILTNPPQLATGSLDAAGLGNLPAAMPATGSLFGAVFYLQSVVVNPATLRFRWSNVEVLIGTN